MNRSKSCHGANKWQDRPTARPEGKKEWPRVRTGGDGGADADEDEEEGEDELAEHGAEAAGVRCLAPVAQHQLRQRQRHLDRYGRLT